MLKIRCRCGKTANVPSSFGGRELRCRRCLQTVRVAAPKNPDRIFEFHTRLRHGVQRLLLLSSVFSAINFLALLLDSPHRDGRREFAIQLTRGPRDRLELIGVWIGSFALAVTLYVFYRVAARYQRYFVHHESIGLVLMLIFIPCQYLSDPSLLSNYVSAVALGLGAASLFWACRAGSRIRRYAVE